MYPFAKSELKRGGEVIASPYPLLTPPTGRGTGPLALRERVGERVFHPFALRERVGERVFLLLLLLLLLPACRQAAPVDQAPDVQVLLTPGPDSLFVGPITFDLTLWDADGQPIDGAAPVSLRGDMSHAGMEPVLAEATGAGDGLYTADFEWTMAGDWTVTVEATLPDGRLKIATFAFAVEEFEATE